jgi:hypothetical protein
MVVAAVAVAVGGGEGIDCHWYMVAKMALTIAAVALEMALASIYEAFCGCDDGGDNFILNIRLLLQILQRIWFRIRIRIRIRKFYFGSWDPDPAERFGSFRIRIHNTVPPAAI